jgi:hypothetical protein
MMEENYLDHLARAFGLARGYLESDESLRARIAEEVHEMAAP